MREGYLLDTNQLSEAVEPSSHVRRRIRAAHARGDRVGTCIPVLCEVEAGIQHVKHPAAYYADLRHVMRLVRVWPLDLTTARLYGEIHSDLRRRGRALSQVDMMLAALARQMALVLVSADYDFQALPDIPTENWSTPSP